MQTVNNKRPAFARSSAASRLFSAAACSNHPMLSPEAWEPSSRRDFLEKDQHQAAAVVCKHCPVAKECAQVELAGRVSSEVIRAGVHLDWKTRRVSKERELLRRIAQGEAVADVVGPFAAQDGAEPNPRAA